MKAVLILALVALCSAKVTSWTGGSSLSNYWNDNGNWDNGAPSSGDDAVLNAARPCLITADVNVNSIKLSGSARVTLTAFQLTAASISIQDSAVLQFQGGGAWTPSLKSTNLSTIASQGGLEFHSGNLEGNWEVASTGSISFPDPATAFLVNAQVKSQGSISFGGKSVFLNSSTIYSEGSGKFVLNQGAVLATLDDTSALKSTAGVTINGQAEIQGNAFITGLVVSENSAVSFSKGSQSVVNGVTLKAGARLQNTASGQPTLNNVNGEAGSILYAGLPLTIGGSVSLDTLNVDTHGLNTPASFTGTSNLNVNNLIMTSGGVRLNGALSVNTLTVNSGVSFSGGSFNIKSSKFSVGSSGGVTQFNTIFNSLGDTTVLTSQMWNVVPPATLNFGGNASLSVQKDLQVFGVGPTQQMVLNLAGVANIAEDASLSLTSLPVNGGNAGTWKVNGKLSVTSLSFITKTVSLPSLGSNFQIGGSTMTIGTVETASNYKLNVTDRGISYVTGPTIYGLSSTTATAIGITVSN